MSDDQNDLPPWRRKLLATRMAIESILFERELMQVKKEKPAKGLLVLLAVWLFHALLLAQWALRRGYFFGSADAESFGGVLRYASYLKAEGFWALIKPEFADLTLNPPLYYLAYVPVLNYLTTDLNLALILVNSFFLLVLALSVFLAVRESRPNSAGWFGAAFVLALPFVMETARRPAPEMALLALTAAMYASFIRSDEFLNPKWTLSFVICLGLGFFSHRAFWIYALPLAPYVLSGLANPNARDEFFKGLLPGVVLNLPWYLFAIAAAAAGIVPLWGDYHGFWHYFKLGLGSAGLPLFVLGGAALAWMYFSVFMAYSQKKIVAAWFWVPYLVLAWGARGSNAELFYPAMLPFAIAAAIMTPHQARKYAMILVLALGAVNQSGYVRPYPAGSAYPVFGLPLPAAGDYRAKEIMAQVDANTPAEGGLAAVYGDDNLNAASLRYAASRGPAPVKFADSPACPGCAFLLVHKTPRFGQPDSAANRAFAALKKTDWFHAVFEKREALRLADGSDAEIYVKVPSVIKFFDEGEHAVRNLALGPLKMEDATLTLSGFNPATGAYARAHLFAPAAELLGGDIYGLELDLTGLVAAGPGLNPFQPAGVASVSLRSARISEYAIERFLADRFPFVKEIEVTLQDGLAVSGVARGRSLRAVFELDVKHGGLLELKPVYFKLGPVVSESFLLKLFTFRLDFRDNPYGIKVSGLRITRNMLELL